MKNRTINTFGLKYISEEVFAKIQSYTIGKNDLYVTIAGTIGVVGEVPEILDGMNLTENAVKVCNISINKTFLCYVMLSELVQQQFQDKTHQVAMPKLALERILGTLIPVCPVKEQQLIVFSIKSALQIADTIEIQKDTLFELVSATKSKILDLAIRGKLVPQDPNDEPASVLLERIRAKKEELIKQGKIKRDKKESVIFKGDDNSYYEKMPTGEVKCIDDELPFDIPEGWEWCNLCDLVSVLNGDRGQNYPAKSKLQKWGIPFVSASNIVDGVVSGDRSDMFYLSDEQFDALNAGKLISGDIVYCIRGSLGKCGIFHDEKGAIASSLVIVRPYMKTQELLSYIFLYLNSNLAKREINKYDNGSAQPNLAAKDFMRFMVPLPPYCEMSSILIRVNKLNNQIANIEASLR